MFLFANHQTEADPAVMALLLETSHPYLAENLVISCTLMRIMTAHRSAFRMFSFSLDVQTHGLNNAGDVFHYFFRLTLPAIESYSILSANPSAWAGSFFALFFSELLDLESMRCHNVAYCRTAGSFTIGQRYFYVSSFCQLA